MSVSMATRWRRGVREWRGGRCCHPSEGSVVAWVRVTAVGKPRTRHIPNILAVESTGITSGLDRYKVRGFLGIGSE